MSRSISIASSWTWSWLTWAFYPLYWEVIPVLATKGVKLSAMGARNMGRFVEWDKTG